MRSYSITAPFMVVTSIGAAIAASPSSNLVGTVAIEHCGNADACRLVVATTRESSCVSQPRVINRL